MRTAVLRPLETLPLREHQRVRVTVSDFDNHAEAWLDNEYLVSLDAMQESEPTLEEVRGILSKIPGNLSDDIRAERDSHS
jgi:hypothetical protein